MWKRNRYSLLETTKSRDKWLPHAKIKPVNGQLTVIGWSPPPKGTGDFTAEVCSEHLALGVSVKK